MRKQMTTHRTCSRRHPLARRLQRRRPGAGIDIPTVAFEEILEESFGRDPLGTSDYSCWGNTLTLEFNTGHGLMEMDLARR